MCFKNIMQPFFLLREKQALGPLYHIMLLCINTAFVFTWCTPKTDFSWLLDCETHKGTGIQFQKRLNGWVWLPQVEYTTDVVC